MVSGSAHVALCPHSIRCIQHFYFFAALAPAMLRCVRAAVLLVFQQSFKPTLFSNFVWAVSPIIQLAGYNIVYIVLRWVRINNGQNSACAYYTSQMRAFLLRRRTQKEQIPYTCCQLLTIPVYRTRVTKSRFASYSRTRQSQAVQTVCVLLACCAQARSFWMPYAREMTLI